MFIKWLWFFWFVQWFSQVQFTGTCRVLLDYLHFLPMLIIIQRKLLYYLFRCIYLITLVVQLNYLIIRRSSVVVVTSPILQSLLQFSFWTYDFESFLQWWMFTTEALVDNLVISVFVFFFNYTLLYQQNSVANILLFSPLIYFFRQHIMTQKWSENELRCNIIDKHENPADKLYKGVKPFNIRVQQ